MSVYTFEIFFCLFQSRNSKMATVGEQMQISNHTIDKVTRAKVTLENYYSNLISQHEERETRYVKMHIHQENTVMTLKYFFIF